MVGNRTLLLNASYEPLNVVSWQRALQLLFQGKVEVVEESTRLVKTVSLSIRVPSILRLVDFVQLQKKKRTVRFSRQNVFIRDKNKCQYCAKKFAKSNLTLDHVIPVVQGGKKNWENIVTSCKLCNQKKGGRTPRQAGMKLQGDPMEPSWLPRTGFELSIAFAPDEWRIYLKYSIETDLD